jgi:MYXO-CTERM domain-containing protein
VGCPARRAVSLAIAITVGGLASGGVARAQVAYDADSRADAIASSLSFDHTVGALADRLLLVVVVMADATARVSSVSAGGAGLAAVGGVNASGNACRVELWRRIAPTSGRQTVEVQTSSGTHIFAVAISYSGVDQANPTSAAATAAGSGSVATVSLASAAADTVVDWICAGGGSVVQGMPGVDQTRRDSWGGDPAGGVSDRSGASPTVEMTWRSAGSFDWGMGAVSLHPAPPPPADAGVADGSMDATAADAPTAADATEADAGTEVDTGGAVALPEDAGIQIDHPGDAQTAKVNLAVGCACRAAPAPGPGLPVLAGLAVLAALRRRRRR